MAPDTFRELEWKRGDIAVALVRDILGKGTPLRDFVESGKIVTLGAAVGTAAGGVYGMKTGFKAASLDKASPTWETQGIKKPRLVGFHFHADEDAYWETHTRTYSETHYREDCQTVYHGNEPETECTQEPYTETHTETYQEKHVRGYWHRFSPDVDWKKVGEYKVATGYEHSEWKDPLSAGFAGVVGGLAVGVGVGAVIHVAANALLSKLDDDDSSMESRSPFTGGVSRRDGVYEYEPERRISRTSALKNLWKNNEDFLTTTAAIGGIIGAGVGGYYGYQGGLDQQNRNQTVTQTWKEPDLTRQYLGDVPETHYSYWAHMDTGPLGSKYQRYPDDTLRLPSQKDPVYRDTPQYEADGSIKMKTVSKTFDSAKYGTVGGTLGGMAIGTGIGIGAGIVSGLLIKLIADCTEKP